ncbi:ABC transporter substrate-binding protein [Zobellella sp. DQSA1]|uniref:ABC transporter substrate-binding protein n=1 Tax=Zobellella sp. DQSA1 TaxID=3342386 RepID=UPI0035C1C75B
MVKRIFLPLLVLLHLPAWGETAAGCRLLSHAMGESCVPEQPRRVAVLDTGELDMALALGVTPIAATTPYQVGQFPAYLALAAAPVSLGVVQEPDLERLMRLQPDLILGSRLRHGRLYPLLSGVAPTVFSESVGAGWAENFRLFARALDREPEAERRLAAIDARCRRIATLHARKGHPTLSLVRSMQTHVRLYLRDSFVGSLLVRCGLDRPASQAGGGFARQLASPRHIDALDGDIILLSEYAPGKGSLIRRWQDSAFWSRLDGRLYEVDDGYWMLGIGPLAAERILMDLERIIDDYPPR